MKFETAVPIRSARPGEIDAAASIMLRAFEGHENARLGAGYARAFVRSFLEAESRSLLVAEQHGEIVGFAAAEDSELRAVRYRELRAAAAAAFLRRPWLVLNADVIRMARQRLSMSGRSPLPSSWFLSLVGVHPEARGCGVGRALLRAFEDEGRHRGYERATLLVRDDNLAALALYESNGWQQCGSATAGRTAWQRALVDEQSQPRVRAKQA